MSAAPLRVAFVDQVGQTAGGAERSLAIFLAHVPASIQPIVVLFEEGDFAQELRGNGIRVEVVRTSSALANATRERPGLGALFSVPMAVSRVYWLLRRNRIDLVYTNSMKAHFIGGLAAWLAGIPCLVHFHDLYEGKALLALRTITRLVSRERIACSHLVADAMAVGSTRAIYGPVEVASYATLPEKATALERLAIPGDLPIVALIGRINRWKGHDRFLRIAALVNERFAARFMIVGAPLFRDADFVPELHELVERLKLEDRVHFVPWLEDMHDVFAVSSLNVNCSTREPFGRAVPEAAAAGLPTVCFSDSGVAETIVDGVNGRAIDPGDEAGFADAIVSYLENEAELHKASCAALLYAISFDASRIARQTSLVIERAAMPRVRLVASR